MNIVDNINIDAIDFCSIIEFADKYDGCDFYYIKNGERKFISSQDAYLYLCMKYAQNQLSQQRRKIFAENTLRH